MRSIIVLAGMPVTLVQTVGDHTSVVLVFNRQGQLTKRITCAEGSSPATEILKP